MSRAGDAMRVLASVSLVACGSARSGGVADAGSELRDAPLTIVLVDARADAAHAPSHDASHDGGPHDVADAGPPSRANGTLGAWQSAPPMPIPRANHCAVSAGGYLVVLGGNYMPDGGSTFVDIDAVNVALIHADGSLGPWSQAGTTPSTVSACTATASGSTIYLIDGIYDDMADQGHAFSAELSSSGALGEWKPLGPLPNGQDAFASDAWIAGNAAATLYVMDSNMTTTAVLSAPTAPSFGAWAEDDWLSGFLGRPEYAFTGAYVYAMGGYLSTDGGNPAVTTVTGAPVLASGSIGSPFVTEPLPMPITFGRGVAVDDWIFVVGGKTSVFGSGVTGAWSSLVGSNGTLGPWTAQSGLPEGRTDMALTLVGDFLYLTGGGYMGPGVSDVFIVRVRY